MPNEKVSQMTMLTSAEIAPEDIFLVGDISAHESKQMTSEQLLLFIEISGSFNAVTSGLSATTSYVLGSNVDGAVRSSSFADRTISSSHALASNTSLTASYFSSSVPPLETASYLRYQGFPNGTSSYALNAGSSLTSIVASNLSYIGIPNGTASYAISSSYTISGSYSKTSSYSSTSTSSSYSATSSFSSNSMTASFFGGGSTIGPKFITPVVVYSASLAIGFTNFDCSAFIPTTATSVILEGWAVLVNSAQGYIFIRKDAVSSQYVALYYAAGDSIAQTSNFQGVFPISSSNSDTVKTFQYSATANVSNTISIRLIGYY